jgi:hypothetical protein
MSPTDDDRLEEMQRLALITRMLHDPGTTSELDDLLGEEETAALLRCPDVRTTRKSSRKATS